MPERPARPLHAPRPMCDHFGTGVRQEPLVTSPTARKFELVPGKRILFLTKDPDLVRRQLHEGLDLRFHARDMADPKILAEHAARVRSALD